MTWWRDDGAGFQPLWCLRCVPWGVAPGNWFEDAPLALKTYVKVLGMRLAFQDVNVMEFHPSLRSFAALRALQSAGLPSRSSERCHLPLFRPAFALRATARQSSLLRCAPSEDWRRRELNPRP